MCIWTCMQGNYEPRDKAKEAASKISKPCRYQIPVSGVRALCLRTSHFINRRWSLEPIPDRELNWSPLLKLDSQTAMPTEQEVTNEKVCAAEACSQESVSMGQPSHSLCGQKNFKWTQGECAPRSLAQGSVKTASRNSFQVPINMNSQLSSQNSQGKNAPWTRVNRNNHQQKQASPSKDFRYQNS